MTNRDYTPEPLELLRDCEAYDKLAELAIQYPWMEPLRAAAQKKLQADFSDLEPEQQSLL